MALGWGLWEGPARFYFQPFLKPARITTSIELTLVRRLTFIISGIT